MEYRIFCNDLKAEVEKMMGKNYAVRLETVTRNNHVTYEAIIILKKGENMAPSIRLSEYYDEYQQGRNITDIALSVIVWYERYKDEISVNTSDFFDYGKMRNNIYVKVVNAGLNEQLLREIPHVRYYDLAMIAYTVIDEKGKCRGTATVSNAQIKLWNVGVEKLFHDAIKNTRKSNPPKFEHMSDVMKEILATKVRNMKYVVGTDEAMDNVLAQIIAEIDAMDSQRIFVLSNAKKTDGAVYMLFDDVLEKIAEQLDADMYIMPSSIHEVLVVAKEEGVDYDYLRETVNYVNENEVAPEEILSDSVYLYERGKGITWKNA